MSAFRPVPFVPAPGLAGPHTQTILGSLARPRHVPRLRRERLDTPDGDFVDLDVVDADPASPHVFVLHGLEGSSESGYVRAMLRGAHERGWGAVALNFRSCSGEPNRTLRSYHSGETGDVLHAVEKLRARVRGPLYAAGFSLGGNVLLKLLGDLGKEAPFAAAAAVSTPYDLAACARSLDTPGPRMALYRQVFLRSLKAKTLAKARAHPGLVDERRVRRARTITAFDDAVTAPLHGFRDAGDYYERCSSGPGLARIRIPTLLVSAEDDPLIPPAAIPQVSSPELTWLVTPHGGHVGFIGGTFRHPHFWAEAQALSFFDAQPR